MLVPTDNKTKAMHVMVVHDDQKSPETFDKKGNCCLYLHSS